MLENTAVEINQIIKTYQNLSNLEKLMASIRGTVIWHIVLANSGADLECRE